MKDVKKELQKLINQVNANLIGIEIQRDDDKIDLYEVKQLEIVNKEGVNLTNKKRLKTIFGGNKMAIQCYLIGMVQMVYLGKTSGENLMAMTKPKSPLVTPVDEIIQ